MISRKSCGYLLKLGGWKAVGEVPNVPKCIIVGVPHTSSWDFIMSWLFYRSLGGSANIIIKKEFFFWPIGYILRKMGGIAVDRSKGSNLIRQIVRLFEERDFMHLAITPEGTRKRTKRWKAGFHNIAGMANVPVYLASFDWGRKQMTLWGEFPLTDDAKADINRMKDFFREKGIQGKYPENFSTEHE